MSRARMVYTAAAAAATVGAGFLYSHQKHNTRGSLAAKTHADHHVNTYSSRIENKRVPIENFHATSVVKSTVEFKNPLNHLQSRPLLHAHATDQKKNEAMANQTKQAESSVKNFGLFSVDRVKSHFDIGKALLKQGKVVLAKVSFAKMLFAQPKKIDHAALYEATGYLFIDIFNRSEEASLFFTIATLLKASRFTEMDQFVQQIKLSTDPVLDKPSSLNMKI